MTILWVSSSCSPPNFWNPMTWVLLFFQGFSGKNPHFCHNSKPPTQIIKPPAWSICWPFRNHVENIRIQHQLTVQNHHILKHSQLVCSILAIPCFFHQGIGATVPGLENWCFQLLRSLWSPTGAPRWEGQEKHRIYWHVYIYIFNINIIYIYIYLSIYLSMYLSIYLSIYLIYLSKV